MQIAVHDNTAHVALPIRNSDGVFREIKCVVDTGCEASLVVVGASDEELEYLRFVDVRELPEELWCLMADGRRARTFEALTEVLLEETPLSVDTLIIEGQQGSAPLLGMQFLSGNQRHLSLNFPIEEFFLR